MAAVVRRGVSPLLLWVLAVGAAACVSGPPVAPSTRPAPPGFELPATIRVRARGLITTVPLEEYVLASALSEVSPAGESAATVGRIFEVQAILARTYAATNLGRHRSEGFDLCDDTHCQLYEPSRIATSRFAAAARAATLATRGDVIVFDGRPARALFHADCGGHTAPAESVWTGQPIAYLAGVRDEAPAAAHRRWQFSTTLPALGALLVPATAGGRGPLTGLDVVARDTSGRVARIEVAGPVGRSMTGEEFRRVVNGRFGPTAIRSTRFDIARAGGQIVFAGTGFGHGVGVCQVGAAARARRGETPAQILASYLPGTRVQHPDAAAEFDPSSSPFPFPRSPWTARRLP